MKRRWMRKQRTLRQGRKEWVGGRFVLPVSITGEGAAYRPAATVWLELPDGIVVQNETYDPREGEASLVDALLDAIAEPMLGPPRRPNRVRVASTEDALELREHFGPALEVVVAPTPEIDALARSFAEHLQRDSSAGSWLEELPGDAPELPRFFRAVELLQRAAPWEIVGDDVPVRVEIPSLGIEAACASIMGHAKQSFGFLLFPSFAGLDVFVAASQVARSRREHDFGTPWLALNLERGADVPAEVRKQIAARKLPIAAPTAYPWPADHDRDGTPRQLTPEKLDVLGATAAAIASVFVQFGSAIAAGESVSVTIETEDHPAVRITIPYEARDDEGDVATVPVRSAGSERGPSPIHDVDYRLTAMLARWAAERFGDAWFAFRDDFDDDASPQLVMPWAIYVHEVEGAPVFAHFLRAHPARLSPTERAWLDAQQRAWLSIWEAEKVEPGVGLHLHDLLTGERRFVREVGGSRGVPVRTTLLARVVEHAGAFVMCGSHWRPLGPMDAGPAVDAIKKRLRKSRARSLPIEALQNAKTARVLLAAWEDAVARADAQRAAIPKLHNTDGDPLLMTTDTFGFAAEQRSAVMEAIAALEDTELDGDDVVVFLRSDETVIGRAVFGTRDLRLETNSIKRADRLRKRVESACGARVTHRIRSHSDPEAQLRQPGSKLPAEPAIVSDEADALIRDFKQKHYQSWLDTPIPALGNTTPRAAAKSSAGKRKVETLLKELELMESRLPPAQRVDLTALRRELRLD